MISINEALAMVQAKSFTTASVEIAYDKTLGRVLAADISAGEPSPRFDNSAMDGFAVRAADIAEASPDTPVCLPLVGESRAGIPFAGQGTDNTCIQISTGAMLPADYDTVIRVEDTEESAAGILIKAAARQGKDVRYSGEEYRAGDKLMASGQRLSARHLAILAAAGADKVTVYAKPRVALLVTGSELTASGKDLEAGQIRDSNRTMLAAAITEAGGEVIHSSRVGDDLDDTVGAMRQALEKTPDLVICAGGVSVGPHDHVKTAAAKVGFKENFWRVKQKPGKPLFFAGRDKCLFFGLPGNPVSAYICFCHYLAPLIGAMSGLPWQYNTITAQAAEDFYNKGRRPNLVRVNCTDKSDDLPVAQLVSHQGSHMISSIIAADGYLLLPAESRVKAGEKIKINLLP